MGNGNLIKLMRWSIYFYGGVGMLSFKNTWPYERVAGDIYFHECPYCKAGNVLLPIRKRDFQGAIEGVKTHVVLPCCLEKMTVLQADEDYFWSDENLRQRRRLR
jgi:hypothetical protein